VIDPRLPVEEAIHSIRQCKRIVTESLHGAIIADLFRIPWTRVSLYSWQTESVDVSSLKWLDWSLSMKVDGFPSVTSALPVIRRPLGRLRAVPFRWRLESTLGRLISKKASAVEYSLSDEKLLSEKIEATHATVEELKRDYL